MNTNDKTFVINATILKGDIEKEYKNILSTVQKSFESKGFRKGKVPLDIVESQVSKTKIIEEVANNLISKVYSAEIKAKNLKPIISPQIKILNPPVTTDKDWQIEITGCELPDIKIDPKYQEEVKKSTSKDANKIFEIILKHSQVQLPPILIESDVNQRLSQLVDQILQAGLTIEQYLKSKGTTLEKYKQELVSQLTKEWTLNLAVSAIAKKNKITVGKKDIDELMAKDPKIPNNPNLIYFILEQQKVIDFLKTLK